ncbi:molybdopterin-dependent oxidoreductase [Actinoallomurus rhizosphaericola]|uniref:molybdopterin-dependent oxidoreductase n=1 Tax=Actinoallomurus rhizosphaericola TaxID=2952536 RepID=UPI0020916BAF|nr:molybdopterin-dependent oxidoreductase [Actinoallomurus rhizosphaericola]MCO5992939.1 molybdopterin-dependent oxidoreductase [Actinoallomurus rhizosphaericola]
MLRRPDPARLITAIGRFASRERDERDERTAAWLGVALGVSFTVAFVTGLVSHFMQHPPGWAVWPSRPVGLYRLTQGAHVIGGLATIPLLLAKLWTVYPRLWQWPPVRSAGHALERALVFPLVGGALFQLVTGLFNIAYFYPFPFFFTTAHYWTAYIVYGALVVHVANEWAKVRGLRPGRAGADARPTGPSRRGFLATVAGACGLVGLTTVGETFTPLGRLALLAPRRPGVGPQRLPVNKTAAAAGVRPDPAWRLAVTGDVARELSLSLADLRAMPQHVARLPIACVEGWSAEGTWAGVRLRDVLHAAGVDAGARVRVESLEAGGRYRASEVDPPHWHDELTLLAIGLNGEPLSPDHGYPCRLIAPDRPGVLQTKWIARLVVHGS